MSDSPYTVREVSLVMSVTQQTVRDWLRAGKLKGYIPQGTKAWRVHRADLQAFISSGSARERPQLEPQQEGSA